MRIKNGVRFHNPAAAFAASAMVIERICEKYGVAFVITGGIEKHEPPSKHVTGSGWDCRTRDLANEAMKREFSVSVRRALGDGFDVVLESDHLHWEEDPKS